MIHLQPTKKKRIRKPSFWKSYRIGLNEQDSAKLEKYAKDRHMSVSSAVRQMIKKFTDIDTGDLVAKVNTTFELVYGINPSTLNQKSRKREFVDFRHAHRYWLMTSAKLRDSQVGELSNGCDRTTVIHSVATYEQIYKQVPYLRDNHDRFKQLMA